MNTSRNNPSVWFRTLPTALATGCCLSLAACGAAPDVPVAAAIVQSGSPSAASSIEDLFVEAAAVDDGLGSIVYVAEIGDTPAMRGVVGPFDLECTHDNERDCALPEDQRDRMPAQLPAVSNEAPGTTVDTIAALVLTVGDLATVASGPLHISATVFAWQDSATASLDAVDITTPSARSVVIDAFRERGFDPASLDLDSNDQIRIKLEPWGPTAESTAALNDFAALMNELWDRSEAQIQVTSA